MLAGVPRVAERQSAERGETRELLPELLAPCLLVKGQPVKPRFHATVYVVTEAALDDFRDASGRSQEGVKVRIDRALPASVEDGTACRDRDIFGGPLRRLQRLLHLVEMEV